MTDQEFNQTTFSQDPNTLEPTQVKTTTTPPPEVEAVTQTAPVTSKPKNKLPLFLGLFVVLLLLTSIVAVLLIPNQTTSDGVQNDKPNNALIRTPTPIEQMIQKIEAEAILADPNVNPLPFPPVNFGIHLLQAK